MAKHISYPGFVGMNNVQDPARLKGPTRDNPYIEAADLVNVDVTDTFSVKRRPGRAKVYNGAPHSIWSDGKQAYFVEGSSLKRLWENYSAETIRALLAPSLPMVYCPVNYLVACSNGVDLFLIENGIASDFAFSSANFKERVLAGHILAEFGRRLYVAVDNAIYYTDADDIERLDERDDPFVFPSRITMILPMESGIFISADRLYWMGGKGPDEFTLQEVNSYPAIEGTGIREDGKYLGIDGVSGPVALWTSEQGICLGLDNGTVENLTLGKIDFTAQKRGTAIVRKRNGLNQYVVLL